MSLTLTLRDGKQIIPTFDISVNADASVQDLKQQVVEAVSTQEIVTLDQIKLIFAGKLLQDPDMKLSEIFSKNGNSRAIVHFVVIKKNPVDTSSQQIGNQPEFIPEPQPREQIEQQQQPRNQANEEEPKNKIWLFFHLVLLVYILSYGRGRSRFLATSFAALVIFFYKIGWISKILGFFKSLIWNDEHETQQQQQQIDPDEVLPRSKIMRELFLFFVPFVLSIFPSWAPPTSLQFHHAPQHNDARDDNINREFQNNEPLAVM